MFSFSEQIYYGILSSSKTLLISAISTTLWDSTEQDESNFAESTTAAKAENFERELCDFSSNWNNGLKVDMSKEHNKIEQLDGFYDKVDDQDENEYEGSKHYWKTGWLGAAYQNYLDAMEVLNKSDLAISDKEEEKIKVLEARKKPLDRATITILCGAIIDLVRLVSKTNHLEYLY